MEEDNKFMGVSIEELKPFIASHENLMENLDSISIKEKIESLESHLKILEIVKNGSKEKFDFFKMTMIHIIASM